MTERTDMTTSSNAVAPRRLYSVEWTHGDGMDEHALWALLSDSEAATISATLEARGALNVGVYTVDAAYAARFRAVMAEINDDLPEATE